MAEESGERFTHYAQNPAVVRRQRRVVQSPPLEVVPVPVLYGQMLRDLHPVALGFKVAMHWRCGHS